ncbi:hypothetical protein VB566_00430 [Clostridium perfringens]|uniref:hypothetical protein n=1 Tax=Clostridium perfringens TaxID=1502 RepID=UPI002B1FB845|nr:hypothetical protein [Clostridium perfringens]MEA5269344.1 hypothetical protein [Clostridium perfringens]MEA5309353.1 hypothetical protein [Clostridium perfringens]MEA5339824.1 hypothetical protein [Clostridium perfringens]
MSKRLVIAVEFSKSKIEELQLYGKLKEYSAPGSIIKDILKGTLPVSILQDGSNLNE